MSYTNYIPEEQGHLPPPPPPPEKPGRNKWLVGTAITIAVIGLFGVLGALLSEDEGPTTTAPAPTEAPAPTTEAPTTTPAPTTTTAPPTETVDVLSWDAGYESGYSTAPLNEELDSAAVAVCYYITNGGNATYEQDFTDIALEAFGPPQGNAFERGFQAGAFVYLIEYSVETHCPQWEQAPAGVRTWVRTHFEAAV